MMDSIKPISLSEQDYLDILGLIERFNECQTRVELKDALVSHLLPKFKAQAMLYAWIDPDWKEHQLIDTIGISPEDEKPLQQFLALDPLPGKLFNHSRTVVAYDTDLPRDVAQGKIGEFLKDNPQFKPTEDSWFSRFRTSLITVDLPDPSVGMGLHRMVPHDQPWSLRELRMLELLRPHLLQTIKTLFLSQKLVEYKSMIEETLGNSSTATVLAGSDRRIIYFNPAFQELFHSSAGESLPEDLVSLIDHELSKYDPPFNIEDAKIEIPFYKLARQVFRLQITTLKEAEERSLLIRLKPVVESYTKINLFLQEAGLSGREMEIASFIRNGADDKTISLEIFLSIHTVRNHVKSIYKKLDVHTRPQLVALLNRITQQ
jgi:DNA-binding CsgD family transcriptional regulator